MIRLHEQESKIANIVHIFLAPGLFHLHLVYGFTSSMIVDIGLVKAECSIWKYSLFIFFNSATRCRALKNLDAIM